MSPTWKLLAVALLAAPAAGRSLSVSCESAPGGIRSLVVESETAGLTVTESDESIVIQAADPGDDLEPGSLRCEPARGVRVVPGALMGTSTTFVVVSLGREVPRIVRADGRIRLLWVPGREAERPSRDARAAEARPASAEPDEGARREAPEPAATSAGSSAVMEEPTRQAAPEPAPSRRRAAPPQPPATPAPAPAATRPDGMPADFLPLDRPADMVAATATEARTGPGRRFAVDRQLDLGARVTADGRAGDWLRTTDGTWVFGPYFEAPEEVIVAGAFVARVTAISAPVHAGPAASFEIVAEVYRGEQVVIDEVKNEWAHVRDGGWVRLSELERQAPGPGKD